MKWCFRKKRIEEEQKERPNSVIEKSNIIQFDDMGYPLLLCITANGDQQWIDVPEEWAKEGIKSGALKVLEWGIVI